MYHYYNYGGSEQKEKSKQEDASPIEKRRAYEQKLRLLKQRGFELVIEPDEFKARLSLSLEFSGKSRKQIEAEKNISSSMISTYLNTSIKPSLDTYLDLCDCLGVSPFWLMGSILEADIEFGLDPSQRLWNRHSFTLSDQRSFKLAVMLAVHSRFGPESIEDLFYIIKALPNHSKHQLKLVREILDSMSMSRFGDMNRYNALLTQPELENPYQPILELNQLSNRFYQSFTNGSTDHPVNQIHHFLFDPSRHFKMKRSTSVIPESITTKSQTKTKRTLELLESDLLPFNNLNSESTNESTTENTDVLPQEFENDFISFFGDNLKMKNVAKEFLAFYKEKSKQEKQSG